MTAKKKKNQKKTQNKAKKKSLRNKKIVIIELAIIISLLILFFFGTLNNIEKIKQNKFIASCNNAFGEDNWVVKTHTKVFKTTYRCEKKLIVLDTGWILPG